MQQNAPVVPEDELSDQRVDEATVVLVGAEIHVDARFLADVALSTAAGGIPDSVIFTAQSGTSLTVSVLAEPVGADRWQSGLAADTAAMLNNDLTSHRRDDENDQGDDDAELGVGTVSIVAGRFGPEIQVHDSAGHLRMAKLGSDGQRWTVLVTCFGAMVTREDLDSARRILDSIVVYRGPEPMPPDHPLSMQLIEDTGG